jgi:hypothetical protein
VWKELSPFEMARMAVSDMLDAYEVVTARTCAEAGPGSPTRNQPVGRLTYGSESDDFATKMAVTTAVQRLISSHYVKIDERLGGRPSA